MTGMSGHVIIGGFGRVGQLIAQMLSERLIPFVALDVSASRVQVGAVCGLAWCGASWFWASSGRILGGVEGGEGRAWWPWLPAPHTCRWAGGSRGRECRAS